MRVALQEVAVLERSRFAFVDVHCHQARLAFGSDDSPLAPRRKSRTAQAPQARVLHHLRDLVARALAGEACRKQLVTARSAVMRVADALRLRATRIVGRDRRTDFFRGRVSDRIAVHHGDRCDLATPDAGRRNHPHLLAEDRRQLFQQLLRACKLAGNGVAHAHRQSGRRLLALLHHIEVVIEGCNFVHLGLRQAHLLGERREMRSRQAAVSVLQPVQVLDQKVAPARLRNARLARLFQHRTYFLQRLRLHGTAFGRRANLHGSSLVGIIIVYHSRENS